MENSKEDSDSSSCQSSTETQFLEQVKECQQHLRCMEKLFFDLQKVPGSERQFKQSCTSLNDFDHSIDKKYKLSNSSPDLQLLMQELETQLNPKNMFKEIDSTKSQKDIPLNIQLESLNNNTSSPLTFLVQVPNSILNLLKKISSDDFSDLSSQYSKKYGTATHKKVRSVSLLQRLFRKKRNNVLSKEDIKISHNTEFLKDKSQENINNSPQTANTSNSDFKANISNTLFIGKCVPCENSTNTEANDKFSSSQDSQTLIFPITYNFNEKSSIAVKPNVTIQHEILPQSNANAPSYSIKITNEVPVQCSEKSSNTSEKKAEKEKCDVENSKKEIQPTELLLESLIKALHKTIERLNSLETLKVFAEKLNEKELKIKKFHQGNKNFKLKNSKESKTLNHLMQHIMSDIETKKKMSKPLQKNMQQTPKRQSSKLSVCSSTGSLSSDGDLLYRSPITLKRPHIQKHAKCHSPSMLNYLVCQSERDIDRKIN